MSQIARSPRQLGAAIQRQRQERGLTQTQLAQLAGTKQKMVSIIEAGHEGVRLSTIFDLLRALDLELTVARRSSVSEFDTLDIF